MADAVHDGAAGSSPLYTPQTTYPEVTFALKGIQPPSQLYVTRENVLTITTLNSATGLTLDLRGQLLRPDGRVIPFIYSHTPNTNRTAKTDVFPIPEGFLISLVVLNMAGSVRDGQCWVSVGLGRGDATTNLGFFVLIADYVAANQALNWPGSPLSHMASRRGVMRFIVGTVPGAGAEISETVPTGARWRLVAINALLATSAAAGVRQPALILDNGASIFFQSGSPDTVGPSLSRLFVWGEGAALATVSMAGNSPAFIPDSNGLISPFRIRTVTTNINAADQWTAPLYLVEEWIDG